LSQAASSQVIVIIRQFGTGSLRNFSLVCGNHLRIHLHFGRSESGHGDELQVGISNQLSGEVEERLLEVVVALGTYVVVLNGSHNMKRVNRREISTNLQVLLAVKSDGLRPYLAILDVDLVANQHRRDTLADSG
jgi:hypothetical protein